VLIIEVKLYYAESGIVTLCRWPLGAEVKRGQFDLLMMGTTVLETCRGI
jgi:hypothetical protein